MAMAQCEGIDGEVPVIEAIQAGDRYAFRELVQRHNRWVRGIAYGVLGDRDCLDDVVQQVWMAAWKRIDELRDASRWRPWLYRLARNASIDAGRDITRRRLRTSALAEEPAPRPAAAMPGTDVEMDERHRQVLSAIQALPALYREPFVLRHLNGWTYGEIAELMSMPVDSVETRLVRARRLLRESLKGKVV